MWPSGEETVHAGGRVSSGSEVEIIGTQAAAPAPSLPVSADAPVISTLNVSKSNKFHIGNKFVSVTNNVHSNEVVKDVSFPRYMLDLIKNTTRAERVSCSVAMFLIIICITLIIYFTAIPQTPATQDDYILQPAWNISRTMWLARIYNTTECTSKYEPLRLVIVAHSASTPCFEYTYCCAEMRRLQNYFLDEKRYDLPYNFMVGNDGRVYEALGWNKEGAHTLKYNKCSLGIGFIGDYRSAADAPSAVKVTEAQLNRTLMLLEEGVLLGYIHPKYKVLGAKDLRPSASPGVNLYNAIRKWDHYDHKGLYKNKTCDQIYDLPIED